MDRLCATLAYSRRTARKLNIFEVANQISKLLHQVHILQQEEKDTLTTAHPAQNAVMHRPASSSGDLSRSSQRQHLPETGGPAEEFSVGSENGKENLGKCKLQEPGTLAQTSDVQHSPMNATQQALDENKYKVQNLRQIIQEQLASIDVAQQAALVETWCAQTLATVTASITAPLAIQILRADPYIIFLHHYIYILLFKSGPIFTGLNKTPCE
eukprot:Skav222770  [mRNA]  locus=scaffold600:334731:335390:+ [translate_table: standard]